MNITLQFLQCDYFLQLLYACLCMCIHVAVFMYLYFMLSLAIQFPTVSGDYIRIRICAGLFA